MTTKGETMTTTYRDLTEINIITALPDTVSARPGWHGVVHVHYTQGRGAMRQELRKDVLVSHFDDGTKDEYGNDTVKRFDSDADALNAALRLSKRIISRDRKL